MTDRTQRMIELYRSGMTLAEVGEEFGISRQRVWQILTSEGVTLRPNWLRSKQQGAIVRKLAEAGHSERAIAKIVGVSKTTVHRYLTEGP